MLHKARQTAFVPALLILREDLEQRETVIDCPVPFMKIANLPDQVTRNGVKESPCSRLWSQQADPSRFIGPRFRIDPTYAMVEYVFVLLP
ncbi:hypothetical protein ACVJBD_000043 [Rhizobium mongolense]